MMANILSMMVVNILGFSLPVILSSLGFPRGRRLDFMSVCVLEVEFLKKIYSVKVE